MKYECEHAYSRDDIPYILCDREKVPKRNQQKEISGACCPFQRFCGTKNCKVLTQQWAGCLKNKKDTNAEGVMEAKAAEKVEIAEKKATEAEVSKKKSSKKTK